ncbi:MAG: actin-domain-containing protein [Olpidium bornovanus]|uniref:Actin-domain-containing protein n=1 Tax=Olpidium bornovanus TaxID=278681 RepID=A0A8H8DEK2_9FUNG|nr:MAG: actin-domain-containing protein [Olpidium bornovanus]
MFNPFSYLVCKPDPSLEGAVGVHQLAQQSIASCDPDARPQLYGNLVLTGGSSQFNGFPDRLHAELLQLTPGVKLKIHAPGNTVERKHSTCFHSKT